MTAQSSSSAYPAFGKDPRWVTLAGCFLCYGFDAVDFMVLALALPAIVSDFGLTLGEAGLIGTAGMIGVGLSSMLLGWYADNHGRRPALIASVLIFALFTVAIAFARGWWDMMILRLLAGLGLGGVWGVVSAFINETWPRQSRGRASAFVLSAWPVGFILAALLAHLLLPAHGWRGLFLSGGLALVAAIFVLVFVPESAVWREEKARRQSALGNRPVPLQEIFTDGRWRRTLLATAIAACALTGYWGTNTWLPTYLVKERGLDPSAMTTFLIVMNIGMFVGYQIFGFVADRIGAKATILLCFAATTVLLPIYAMIRDLTLLLWFGPVVALFFAYFGIFGTYFSALFPAHIRSTGAGFCFNIGRGVSAFAPYALGEIATSFSLSVSIALCGVFFLLAGLLMTLMPNMATEDGHVQPTGVPATS
ncbi:MFS transporter [Sphingobium subterraneum]|uniref:MFS family permease n=1 Tax=Sphingobium subterraneum TaxID=627688 RepID=A0A841J316_9SPHN|nr:MFS transporter [Sphingobium subterraneum]MBB6123005.1 MFS family permease [Sphingobium subterraneum]